MTNKSKFEFSKILSKSKNIFDEIDEKISKLQNKIYDCGVLDPAKQSGIPEFIFENLNDYIKSSNKSGYPGNKGETFFLQSCYNYLKRNFDLDLDYLTQINITNGSKTDEFIFPAAFLNLGDLIICPTPGYPAFHQGAKTFGFEIYFTELKEENDFLIDFESIPQEIVEKAKMIRINYPNSPTGSIAPKFWLEKFVKWAHENDIIIAADEVYVDFFYNPDNINNQIEDKQLSHINKNSIGHSILNISTKNVISFFSLSKRSNMSSFRVGFAAGDPILIEGLYKIKNLHDDGVPHIIQKIASNALNNDNHVKKKEYDYCRYSWSNSFNKIVNKKEILPNDDSLLNKGGLFLWQKVPKNYTDKEFADELLNKTGIVVIPGSAFNLKMTNFIRVAMSCDIEYIDEVSKKLNDLSLKYSSYGANNEITQ